MWDTAHSGGPPLTTLTGGNLALHVEGEGWVRQLKHGFPHKRLGLRTAGVEAVDEEPVVLRASGVATLRLQVIRDCTLRVCTPELPLSSQHLSSQLTRVEARTELMRSPSEQGARAQHD